MKYQALSPHFSLWWVVGGFMGWVGGGSVVAGGWVVLAREGGFVDFESGGVGGKRWGWGGGVVGSGWAGDVVGSGWGGGVLGWVGVGW